MYAEKSKMLEEAFINEDMWNSCYIDETGGIWQPQFNLEGKLVRTGEELYQEGLEIKDKPVELQPTEIEILRQEKEVLAKSVYDLTTIVELILTGGITE